MTDLSRITIGVLALQGDFEAHLRHVHLAGARGAEIRLPRQLNEIDALIIPGGESTTMNLLIDRFDLRTPLKEFGRLRPVWGTCAGMIMLSSAIEDNQSNVIPLGLMDITVRRNGYGRQVFSFEDAVRVSIGGAESLINTSFIRAPMITRYGDAVQPLAWYGGHPVMVRQDNLVATSFHTELGDDPSFMSLFLTNFLLGSPVKG